MPSIQKSAVWAVMVVIFLTASFSLPEKASADRSWSSDVSCAMGSCYTGSCPAGAIDTRAACSISGVAGVCCLPPAAAATPACAGTCRTPSCNAGEATGAACATGGVCCTSAAAGVVTPVTFSNPLRFSTVEEVLTALLGSLQAIIVILSIIFIIIGAIMYITSAGDEGRMKTAKGAITAAMIGLALGLAAPSFLKEIGTILGWNGVDAGPVGSALTLTAIATNVLNFLLSVLGILGIIMLVVGGMAYLTAAGDENRMETGKKIVTYSIIGIIVALASLVLVTQIANFFS